MSRGRGAGLGFGHGLPGAHDPGGGRRSASRCTSPSAASPEGGVYSGRMFKGRRIAAAALALVLGSGIGGALWIRSVADRRWTALKAWVVEGREARRARPAPPRLSPSSEDRNAWDSYAAAAAAIEGDRETAAHIHKALTQYVELVPAVLQADSVRRALAELRRGARAADGRRPPGFQEPPALRWSGLVHVAILDARGLKSPEALDRLFDAAQFALDVASEQPSYGHHYLGQVLDELKTVMDRLPRNDLIELDRRLEALDRLIPPIGPLEDVDVLDVAGSYVDAPDLHARLRERRCMCAGEQVGLLSAWRYGFSDRLMAAVAIDRALELSRRVAGDASASWSERERSYEALTGEFDRSRNPLLRADVAAVLGFDKLVRDRRTRIRLLRWAARYRATDERPALGDPFGASLLHEATEGRARVWSVGSDGKDDGGRGDWNTGDDLVLEFP